MNRIVAIGLISILLSFIISPTFAFQGDGIWKATHVKTDTLMEYTKMLLRIEGDHFQLVNYDKFLMEKSFFENEGFFRTSDSSLVFSNDSSSQKIYKLNIEDENQLEIITRINPRTSIVFKKLVEYKLGKSMNELGKIMMNNGFNFEFDFFEKTFEIEFFDKNRFMVTSSVETFFPDFSKWAVVKFDSELFIYFSGLAPFLHVISMDSVGITCEDEFDQMYKGHFEKIVIHQKFKKDQFLGIWQEKSANEELLKSVPENLWEKELFPQRIWEIKDESASLSYYFSKHDSPMEINNSGDMINFPMFNGIQNHQLKIISLEKDILVVQRLNQYAEVVNDTLIRQKKMPVPVKLSEFLNARK